MAIISHIIQKPAFGAKITLLDQLTNTMKSGMENYTVEKMSDTYLLVKVPLNISGNLAKISEMPGYSKWEGRALKFRPTSSSLQFLYDNWPELKWVGEANDIIKKHLSDVHLALESKANKQKILEDDGSYEYKTEPYDHQRQAFLLSRDAENFALLMEMGTGKTKVLIDNAAYLYQQDKIDCLVVLAPNGVHRNWIEIEIPVHMPDWCDVSMDYYSAKHGKKRMQHLYSKLSKKNKLCVIAMNIEGFSSQKAKDLLQLVVKEKRCMIALDESTMIKSPGAKRTKYLVKACKDGLYRRIANGAPITKGIEDLYSQFGFLSNKIIGYDTFTSFKSMFCKELMVKIDKSDPNSRKIPMNIGYKNVQLLIDKIDPYSFRVTKKDCLDLPDKVYKLWPVQLSEQQRKAYEELKEEYITQIEDTHIEEEVALVRLLRLQQIICGWYPGEDGKLVPIPGINSRMEALDQACKEVEENKSKAIIWARFKDDIYQIEKLLKGKSVSYHGDVSNDDRVKNVEKFKNDDKIKFMIAMLSSNSGALRGHTWTAANTTIYYSNIYDLDPRQQSEDRMHRIGMGDKALYIDLMALGTTDRKIINALKQKKSIADLVTKDGPSGFLEFINE